MLKLTANKTKLYTLAKSFWPEIQPMKHTEFTKYARVRDYKLSFRAGTYYHELFLSCCWGRVLLADEWSTCDDDGSETKGRETHRLNLDTLRKFDMLEEIPDAKAVQA
jgi:hypothetical protein